MGLAWELSVGADKIMKALQNEGLLFVMWH
jgi:hypothetical protein